MLVVKKTTLEMLFVTDEVLYNDDFPEEKDKDIIYTELQFLLLSLMCFFALDLTKPCTFLSNWFNYIGLV